MTVFDGVRSACTDDMCVVILQKQDLCLYCVLALLVMLLLSHSRRCKLSVWAGPLLQSPQ